MTTRRGGGHRDPNRRQFLRGSLLAVANVAVLAACAPQQAAPAKPAETEACRDRKPAAPQARRGREPAGARRDHRSGRSRCRRPADRRRQAAGDQAGRRRQAGLADAGRRAEDRAPRQADDPRPAGRAVGRRHHPLGDAARLRHAGRPRRRHRQPGAEAGDLLGGARRRRPGSSSCARASSSTTARDFTAADVKASLERIIAQKGPLAPLFAAVEAVETPDPMTLRLKTKQPGRHDPGQRHAADGRPGRAASTPTASSTSRSGPGRSSSSPGGPTPTCASRRTTSTGAGRRPRRRSSSSTSPRSRRG